MSGGNGLGIIVEDIAMRYVCLEEKDEQGYRRETSRLSGNTRTVIAMNIHE